MRVVIIGKGNVATNLHAAFARKGICAEMFSSRDELDKLPTDADVYIYSVRDDALREVVDRVHVSLEALHVHTSGTMSVSVFGADKPHAGVMYPFQSFSKQHILEDFSVVPMFIEASGIDDVSGLYSLALTLTPHVYEASESDRQHLHVAGVFVNNFPNLLYGMASELLDGTQIPFAVLFPLMEETLSKVRTMSPQDAQTGPARRHDQGVMEHHLSLLPTEEMRGIYKLLSSAIESRYKE